MGKGILTVVNAGDTSPSFIPSPRMTIATAAMQGLLAGGMIDNSPSFIAQKAVRYADTLLAELENTNNELEKHKTTTQRADK